MKQASSIFLAIFLMVAGVLSAQITLENPNHLDTIFWPHSGQEMVAMSGSRLQYGAYVLTWVAKANPEVLALSVNLNYTDSAGRILTRTRLEPLISPLTNWQSVSFVTGENKISVNRLLIVPLVSAGHFAIKMNDGLTTTFSDGVVTVTAEYRPDLGQLVVSAKFAYSSVEGVLISLPHFDGNKLNFHQEVLARPNTASGEALCSIPVGPTHLLYEMSVTPLVPAGKTVEIDGHWTPSTEKGKW